MIIIWASGQAAYVGLGAGQSAVSVLGSPPLVTDTFDLDYEIDDTVDIGDAE